MKKSTIVTLVVLVVIFLDQALKFWIKTSFHYSQEQLILGLNWARLHFVENNGMAFGLSFGGITGKILLSIFRIVAVGVLIYYIRYLFRQKASLSILLSFALVLAGAIGNILDSAFYAMIFSETPVHEIGVAEIFPKGGGYGHFLQGKVVDMFYFPIFEGEFPSWIPFFGGEDFLFFRPVFNLADAAITVGVISLLLFQKNFFRNVDESKTEVGQPVAVTEDVNEEA